MKKTSVLAVVGPTASGKSALALSVAQALGGEIVCMDSMQVYKEMDIGTAKPTKEEQALVPHHMLDVVAPWEGYTAADYAQQAEPVLHAIWERRKLPILVGGTGLYLRTLMQGMPLGGVKGDEAVRERLWAIAGGEGGNMRLYTMLEAVDPQAAARLHPNDSRRVIRALEVYEVTQRPMSLQNETVPERPFSFCLIGTAMEREQLYGRIHQRVDHMLESGLLQEVKGLLHSGVSPDSQAMQGIGYKELIPVTEGDLSLEEAVDTLKRNTRRYAKRQGTWFRGEAGIQWVDALSGDANAQALEMAQAFWKAQGNIEGEN